MIIRLTSGLRAPMTDAGDGWLKGGRDCALVVSPVDGLITVSVEGFHGALLLQENGVAVILDGASVNSN
jgi:hypothetical protein